MSNAVLGTCGCGCGIDRQVPLALLGATGRITSRPAPPAPAPPPGRQPPTRGDVPEVHDAALRLAPELPRQAEDAAVEVGKVVVRAGGQACAVEVVQTGRGGGWEVGMYACCLHPAACPVDLPLSPPHLHCRRHRRAPSSPRATWKGGIDVGQDVPSELTAACSPHPPSPRTLRTTAYAHRGPMQARRQAGSPRAALTACAALARACVTCSCRTTAPPSRSSGNAATSPIA